MAAKEIRCHRAGMTTKHTRMGALALAAVVALGAVGCSKNDTPAGGAGGSAQQGSAGTAKNVSGKGTQVFNHNELYSDADIDKQPVGDPFKQVLKSELKKYSASGCKGVISLDAYSWEGYAATAGGCSGDGASGPFTAIVWKKKGEKWTILTETSADKPPACASLRVRGVPKEMLESKACEPLVGGRKDSDKGSDSKDSGTTGEDSRDATPSPETSGSGDPTTQDPTTPDPTRQGTTAPLSDDDIPA